MPLAPNDREDQNACRGNRGLAEADLPSIVQGDVWEQVIRRVSARARELVSASPADASAGPGDSGVASTVGHLTVEQLQKIIVGAVSLAAATAKAGGQPASFDAVQSAATGVAGKVLAGFQVAESLGAAHSAATNKILWVDDRPDNNVYERRTMEAMGFEFVLATSTDEALGILVKQRFAAVISDMGRAEGPREGYVLLEAVRARDKTTPFFIYAASRAPRHMREAALRGAQGTTNVADELVDMIARAVRLEA